MKQKNSCSRLKQIYHYKRFLSNTFYAKHGMRNNKEAVMIVNLSDNSGKFRLFFQSGGQIKKMNSPFTGLCERYDDIHIKNITTTILNICTRGRICIIILPYQSSRLRVRKLDTN